MTDIEEQLQEFVKAIQTLLDHAEQAVQHYRSGDVQAACEMVSLSAAPLSHIGKEWKRILDAFGGHGIHPSQR